MVTWAYAVTSWEDRKSADGTVVTNMLFKRQHIPEPGTYLLGYYSRDRSCLIALSSPFEVGVLIYRVFVCDMYPSPNLRGTLPEPLNLEGGFQ